MDKNALPIPLEPFWVYLRGYKKASRKIETHDFS
jgi:hypothetical protein